MACRCNEIGKCERDIALLSAELNRRLNSARDNNSGAMSQCSGIGQCFLGAVSVDCRDRLSQRFSSIKSRRSTQLDNLHSKRTGELSRLRIRLENYKSEDKRYHEMQALKVR